MSEIRTRLQGGTPFFPNMLNNGKVEVCLKEDVDKAIAEKDKEIAELKKSLENVDRIWKNTNDDRIAAEKKVRMLKRALYKACANWADVEAFEKTEGIGYDNTEAEKWRKMESKCRAMAEEYK